MTPQLHHGNSTMWTNQRQPGPRFLLWVDGVGGYLVCLADEITLGQAVARGGADVPVLVVSMHDEALYAERALRAGAKGYIMKEEAGEQILAAIRCIFEGKVYVSEAVKDKLVQRLA